MKLPWFEVIAVAIPVAYGDQVVHFVPHCGASSGILDADCRTASADFCLMSVPMGSVIDVVGKPRRKTGSARLFSARLKECVHGIAHPEAVVDACPLLDLFSNATSMEIAIAGHA